MQNKSKNWEVIIANSDGLAMEFKTMFDTHGNVPVEYDYVKNCIPILIKKKGKILGGNILNVGTYPFRYFEVFKDASQKQAVLKNEGIEENEIMEISSIFHIKELKPFDRLIFFSILYFHAWKLAKRHDKTIIIGGSLIKKIQDYQMRALTHLLVSMPLDASFSAHRQTSGVAKIYCIERKFFLRNVIRLLMSDLFKATVGRVFKTTSLPKSRGKLVVQQ